MTDELRNTNIYERTKRILEHLGYSRPVQSPDSEEKPSKSQASGVICPRGLDPDEEHFLQEVFHHPTQSVSEHYVRCGFSNNKGGRVKNSLVEQGYIAVHEFNTGSRGGKRQVLEATPKARETLKVKEKLHGKGGFLHRILQEMVAKASWDGGKAVLEKDGYDVVVALPGNTKIAIEIVTPTCVYSQTQNLNRFLEKRDVDELIFLASDRTVRECLKKNLEKNSQTADFEKVRFCLLTEVVPGV